LSIMEELKRGSRLMKELRENLKKTFCTGKN
jgi:hypothetical protein